MSKPSKLLKVVSIIVIVLGSLSVLGAIFTTVMAVTMPDLIAQSYELIGQSAPSTGYYVYTIASACVVLIAGIIGVLHRSKKSVLIMAVIYLVLEFGSVIYSSITIGFSFLYVVDLILPILYAWGWYQSE
ncbi:hypothetical protein [Mediterraneibacter sp. ICN-202921]|uniref:hypothetical protein n=1 Tax=Mediterraneibacter sp. ICN-202921 TaxID=3134657 RepID=UPI000E4D1168|nr:hypothetical protein DWX08_08840 [Ruminococcus sp. AF18-22]